MLWKNKRMQMEFINAMTLIADVARSCDYSININPNSLCRIVHL